MLAKRTYFVVKIFAAAGLAAVVGWILPASRAVAQAAPGNGQEVLTAGPVHEAFAEPTAGNPVAGLVVARKPPDPIAEMPPDVKPEGTNVVWVSGYWAWDDSRKDFIWISGIWRDAPPQHAWVAGYWGQAAEGYQWTPGFWNPVSVEQASYLPQPPQELNNQPSTPAPSANDFWVPGNWQYSDARYVWHAGYWTAAQPDWIWVPAHYVWSPSGYLFLPGHWDYALARRGVLFAPVAFNGAVYAQPGYVYAPSVVIDPGVLTASFFVRPGYGHYYFGDYYGPTYVGLGFTPWFSVGFGYDPLFSYYRWYHREDPHWAIGIRDRYVYLDAHREARPPRTYSEQLRVGVAVGGVAIGLTLNDYVRHASVGPAPMHFARLSAEQRTMISHDAIRNNDIARERAHAEATGGRGFTPGRTLDMKAISRSSGGQLPGAAGAVAHTNTVQGNQAGQHADTFRGAEASKGATGANNGTSKTTAPSGRLPGATPPLPSGHGPSGNPPSNSGKQGGGTARNPKDTKEKPEDPRSRYLVKPEYDPLTSTSPSRGRTDNRKTASDGAASGRSNGRAAAGVPVLTTPGSGPLGGNTPATGAQSGNALSGVGIGRPTQVPQIGPTLPSNTKVDISPFSYRALLAGRDSDGFLLPYNSGSDPVRPLSFSPSSFGRNAVIQAQKPVLDDELIQEPTTDPVRPLSFTPRPTAGAAGRGATSGAASGGGNAGPQAGSDPRGKDPVKSLRVGP